MFDPDFFFIDAETAADKANVIHSLEYDNEVMGEVMDGFMY